MAGYTVVNLKNDVTDMAPQYGMEGVEARFARTNLELEKSGMSYFKCAPNYRAPFGHTHSEQEEVYVIISGSARIKMDEDEVDLKQLDAVRVAPGVMRALQGGPEGAEVLAFGAPNTDNGDAEMKPGWWE